MDSFSKALAKRIDSMNERNRCSLAEMRKYQKKLDNTPLVPRNSRLRKQRDKTMKKLMESARACGRVDEVNLTGGTW